MKPTVGRIVHYQSYGTPGGEYEPACRAAVVTEVTEIEDGGLLVGLAVLNPEGMFFNRFVPEGVRGGTWHWPERED